MGLYKNVGKTVMNYVGPNLILQGHEHKIDSNCYKSYFCSPMCNI
jgi:hypothetical protein